MLIVRIELMRLGIVLRLKVILISNMMAFW
jgi:hypothetical protein